MNLTYEAKIYPNKRQEAKLSAIIEGCRHLYSHAVNILSRGRECLAARVGCRASLRPADVDLQTVFAST